MVERLYNRKKIERIEKAASVMDIISSITMMVAGLYITVSFDWLLDWPSRIMVASAALGYATIILKNELIKITTRLQSIWLKPVLSRSLIDERHQISS